MKARIYRSIEEANYWIDKLNLKVNHIEIQSYKNHTTGIMWSEERVIVYYHT